MWEKTQPKEVHGRSQTIAPESRLEANLEGIVTGRKVYKWSETTERGYMHNFCTFLVLLLLNLLRGTEGIFMGSFLRLIKSRATNIQKKKIQGTLHAGTVVQLKLSSLQSVWLYCDGKVGVLKSWVRVFTMIRWDDLMSFVLHLMIFNCGFNWSHDWIDLSVFWKCDYDLNLWWHFLRNAFLKTLYFPNRIIHHF